MSYDPTADSNVAYVVWADSNVYKDAGITLCADGDSVQQVSDQRGNGNIATQTAATKPVYHTNSGAPSITFNGTTQYMDLSYNSSSIIAGAAVVRSNSGGGTWQSVMGAKSNAGKSLDALYVGVQSGVTTIDNITAPAAVRFITSADPDTTSVDGLVTFPNILSSYYILSWRIKNSYVQVFVNGQLVGQKNYSGTPRTVTARAWACAFYTRTTTDFGKIDAKFLCEYSTLPPDTDWAGLHTYLAARYSITLRTTATVGPYIFPSFQGDAPERQQLSIISGTDAAAFSYLNSYYYPASGQFVRDPSFLSYNGKYWIFHTNDSYQSPSGLTYPFTATTSFTIASSSDGGLTFTKVTDVSAAAIGSVTWTWGPNPFRDGDGTIYAFFGISVSNSATVTIYYVTCTDLTGLTTWTAPTSLTVTGSTSLNDPFMIKIGSTYYLWYEKLGANLSYATSTTATGTFVQQQNPDTDWGGWIAAINTASGAVVTGIEGANLIRLASGSYRLFMDVVAGGTFLGQWYCDSANGTTGWSTALKVSTPGALQVRQGFIARLSTPRVLGGGVLGYGLIDG